MNFEESILISEITGICVCYLVGYIGYRLARRGSLCLISKLLAQSTVGGRGGGGGGKETNGSTELSCCDKPGEDIVIEPSGESGCVSSSTS